MYEYRYGELHEIYIYIYIYVLNHSSSEYKKCKGPKCNVRKKCI